MLYKKDRALPFEGVYNDKARVAFLPGRREVIRRPIQVADEGGCLRTGRLNVSSPSKNFHTI
ncbi:MAG: hypothetical protein GY718_02805 [Lentisphaerae bacterium]|nr:hypothetical protein [Lentisphaerota bacterium]